MEGFARRTRGDAERLEREHLAPGATKSADSRGRQNPEDPDPSRTEFEVDRDRILASKAFRRLKHKTQVFLNPEGDHFVTRLTHTLHVTQIGRTLARRLRLNEDLTESICLGHDVGHSPFGHTGEDALAPYVPSGWLHSEQSVRIFTTLEPLNLTWETLDGVRAHSWKIEPPPGTAEGMLCRFADRIAYLTHDVDDAIRAGILEPGDLPSGLLDALGQPGDEWTESMIGAVVDESVRSGTVSMEAATLDAMHRLRDFMFDRVYLHPDAEAQKRRAIMIIRDLVEYFSERPAEIPPTYRHADSDAATQAIDYVAGMTDRFALRTHDSLFRPEGMD